MRSLKDSGRDSLDSLGSENLALGEFPGRGPDFSTCELHFLKLCLLDLPSDSDSGMTVKVRASHRTIMEMKW